MADCINQCENCRYFETERYKNDMIPPRGVCCRYPRKAGKYPDEYCGEFKKGIHVN